MAAVSAQPDRAHGFVQTGLFVAMETAWIGALALSVDAVIAGTGSAAVLLVCALYPLGLAAEHLIRRARPRERVAWAVHAAAFLAATAAVVLIALPEGERMWRAGDRPLAWLVEDDRGRRLAALACLGLFCWIRGVLVSGRALNAYAVALGFQIGLVVLLTVLAFSSGLGLAWPGAPVLTFAFVLSGLLALWHVRAGRETRRGGAARRSPAAALLGLAMVLGLGLGLAAGFDRSVLDILLALAWRIAEAVGAVVRFLFSLLPEPDPATFDLPEGMEMPVPPPPPEPVSPIRASDLFQRIFGIVFFGMFGLVLAVVLFANLRDLIVWLRKRRDHTPGLDYDRSRHGFGDTLRHLWEGLRDALAAFSRRLRGRLDFRSREVRPDEPIRRAFLRLERRLGLRGWPRWPHETPFDYAGRMKAEWPDPGTDLATLTRTYVAARYGRPRRVPAGRLRKLLKKIGRSLNKVRYREIDADNQRRDSPGN